jgi:hypothetical protein
MKPQNEKEEENEEEEECGGSSCISYYRKLQYFEINYVCQKT